MIVRSQQFLPLPETLINTSSAQDRGEEDSDTRVLYIAYQLSGLFPIFITCLDLFQTMISIAAVTSLNSILYFLIDLIEIS